MVQKPQTAILNVSPVRSRKDWKEFQRFPWKVYADLPSWVPPLLSTQRRELDSNRGPFFEDGSTAEFFIARRGREVVGRIAAIRNERHLSRHHDDVGFFGFFEAIDDVDVAGALLARAEAWLCDQGLIVSRGPASFTLGDPCGVTIKGIDIRPSLLTGYTPLYYAGLLESCGYHKIRDLLCYHVSMDALERNLLKYESAFAQLEKSGVEIRHADRNHMERDARIFARVFSESWDHNWGSFPLLADDFLRAARELGPYFDHRLASIATVFGEPAAVMLVVPDPWEIIQKLNGRIGPGGLLKLLGGINRVERCRIVVLGALPEFRRYPIGPLALRGFQERRADFPALKTIDMSWILEENEITRDLAESLGGEHCRTLRMYDKYLD